MVGATEGKYLSDDAIFTIAPNALMDITIHKGAMKLNDTNWWTIPGQTHTFVDETSEYCFWMSGKTDGALWEVVAANGSTYSNITVRVVVTYGQNQLNYTYKPSTIAEHTADWERLAFYLKVHGAETHDDVTYTAKITFAQGAMAEVAY